MSTTIRIQDTMLYVATSEEYLVDILKELLVNTYIANHTQYNDICVNFNGISGFIPELIFMLRDYFNKNNEVFSHRADGTPMQFATSIFIENCSDDAEADIVIGLGESIGMISRKNNVKWRRSMELLGAMAISLKYCVYGNTDEDTRSVEWQSIESPYNFRRWYYDKYDKLHKIQFWRYLPNRNVREVRSSYLEKYRAKHNIKQEDKVAQYILSSIVANTITVGEAKDFTLYTFGTNKKKNKQGIFHRKQTWTFLKTISCAKGRIRDNTVENKVYAGITKKGEGFIIIPKKIKSTKRLLSLSLIKIINQLRGD